MASSKDQVPGFWFSWRFFITMIGCMAYCIVFVHRVNMSVAIVCMVNNSAVEAEAFKSSNKQYSNTSNAQCMFQNTAQDPSSSYKGGKFNWDKDTQGLILSAYFYGYLLTQVIGGYLSIKLGANRVVAFSVIVGSFLTLAIPYAASLGHQALVACRFLTGFFHGVTYPSMATFWTYWAPKAERTRIMGIATSGAHIGTVVALSSGGFLCAYGFSGGWPSIFYLNALVGFIWSFFWILLVTRSPDENRFISQREKQYIIDNTREAITNATHSPLNIILKLFGSRAWWAMCLPHFCSNFGTFLLLTQLPTYMNEVLKFNIKSNGNLSSLPYIFSWFVVSVSGILGDKIMESGRLSRTNTRKLFSLLGMVLPMLAMILLGFVTCAQPYLGVALLTLGLATNGLACGAGFLITPNDFAGSYAGIAMGMSNTLAAVPGMLAPLFVGHMTKNQSQAEWRVIFFITAGVFLLGGLIFTIFGKTDIEPWARPTKSNQVEEEKITLN